MVAFGIFFTATGSGLGDATLKSAVATLTAIGHFEGAERMVHIRCAKHEDAYYVDLCNDEWQAVRIDAEGWSIVDEPPVLFTRNKNMRPLPTPLRNGKLNLMWKYVNVPELKRILVLTWALDAFRPETPFAVLELCGEQGSAKSTAQRKLRDLCDPNKVALRGKPKTTEDIYVAANNSWVVSFENLSFLSPEQQDAFCTLATGGGFAGRHLYSNGEEFVMESKRPVMLNGISPVSTQPDLIERVISIECPTISPAKRKSEQTLEAGVGEGLPQNIFWSA